MKLNFPGLFGWVILFLWMLPSVAIAQPGASVQLDKPKKYENRTLASEKSTTGKFNPVKKANQNLNTRYNFVFNSERILNEVLSNARTQFVDDFGKLLPFYNYTLDQTANQSDYLDSVLLKCNDAILLHDLRNDWVDDLYLMMGKAYFYKKNFDSAGIAFQYVNFAFQPRNKDEIGYDKAIGSNINTSGNVYTISTKEKSNIVSKSVSHTPARNESLLWLARTMIEQRSYNNAWGIMATLDKDVNFPPRLKKDLDELKAYMFYQQDMYDSSAHYLAKALPNAPSVQEKSRWEYLLAQMLEDSSKPEEAYEYYGKAIGHTTDPILEAYARISQIRLITGEDEEKRIAMNIAELLKMAKKSKYEEYRHIVYYAAAQMELKRNQPAQAIEYLKLSAKYNTTDPSFKARSWLLLGDLAFENRFYSLADFGYDSLDISDPSIPDPETTQERKNLSGEIVDHLENIRVEDSLIRLAALPEEERNSYVKSLVKKLRKERGLKEEEMASNTGSTTVDTRISGVDENQAPPDLFAGNTSKGEWYFYNSSLRAQGLRQFKVTWGNRPNIDNWRRAKGMNIQQPGGASTLPAIEVPDSASVTNSKAQPSDLTVDALKDNIPLTPEKLRASNDTIAFSLHRLGKIFRENIGDCESLIKNNEDLLNRYPSSPYTEEALFGLYYCYEKSGNREKALFYKDYMAKNFNQSRFLRMINDPLGIQKENTQMQAAATKKYEEIYNSFIEGDFNKALAEKKKADSLYGENYWSPQLLYIESVYYVKSRQDSLAIETLKNLMALYHESPISAKAATMIEVLQKRSEIEEYLTSLDVKRATEDSFALIEETVKVKDREQVSKAPTRAPEVKAPDKKGITRADTTSFKAPVMDKQVEGYSFKPADQHLVILLLNKVDIVYVNEARNALNRFNREKYYNTPLEVTNVVLDDNRKMVTISAFANVVEASDYMEKARTSASTDLFPWMPKDKFSFFVITAANLELLKNKKDLDEYLKLFKQSFSGK